MRSILLSSLVVAALSSNALAGDIQALQLVDRYALPYSNGVAYTEFSGTAFAGISGIDYDPAANVYYALSDDRSQNAPGGGNPAARFYEVSINFDASGFIPGNELLINNVTALKQPDGSTFPALGVDPEAIRKSGSSLYWTSEGAVSSTAAPPLQHTFVRRMDLSGNFLAEFATPAKFTPDAVSGQTTGIRNNAAFESLTTTPDGSLVYAAAESALFQDGPRATFSLGSTNRIVRFDAATGQPTAEFVYVTDPIMGATQNTVADNGLVELLAVDHDTLLAVERSFVLNEGNNIRIYKVYVGGASDVSGLNSLVGQSYAAVSKQLLFTLPSPLQGGAFAPDNIEAISFGPNFADGRPSLLLFSDNNFGATQMTQVVLLAGVPEPSTLGLMGALTVGAFFMRRGRRCHEYGVRVSH